MKEQPLNFITQTHEPRSSIVIVQAKKIREYHPQSTFYVYDGGLDQESKNILSSFSHTELVDWTSNSNFTKNTTIFNDYMAKTEDMLKKNKYVNHILSDVFDYSYPYSDLIRWNFFTRQKPLSILDLSKQVDKNIIWLDDDTVLINSISEVFECDFDVGVTIRSKYNEREFNTRPINSGVLFFNCDSDSIELFVRKWLDIINKSNLSPLLEQNAIETIIGDSDIFEKYYNTVEISLNDHDIKMKSFPCDRYNCFSFDNGIHPKNNKILHFKGDKMNKNVNQKLLRDINEGDISNWYRVRLNQCD